MSKAKAFVFAAEEDFGILPVEAQACGTPVIAFGKGGVLESVIENKTGVFFPTQQSGAIINAIELFENEIDNFDHNEIAAHAAKFSPQRFKNELFEFLSRVMTPK
jgi:glycosyltransferase involved in cell wall biosynthesis